MSEEAPPAGGLDGRGAPGGAGLAARRTGFVATASRRDDAPASANDDADGTYAALDLGTNNCRLLIARPTADGFRVVDAFSRIIRLGEGVAASRRISEAAIERAVEALLVCRDKMRARGVRRAAADRHRSLPRRRERRRIPRPRRRASRPRTRDRRFRDRGAAGGGRLHGTVRSGGVRRHPVRYRRRLVRSGAARPAQRRVRRGPPQPDIVGWASLPVGVVTLAERYGGTVVPREIYDAMVEEVAAFVEKFAAERTAATSTASICSARRAR